MFKNLTPHTVRIGEIEIPPSGEVLRLEEEESLPRVVDGIPVVTKRYRLGELPPMLPGVYYLVSLPTLMGMAAANVQRQDFLAPDTGPKSVIRDERGQVVGVRQLMRLG
jgi:hypothetical protein